MKFRKRKCTKLVPNYNNSLGKGWFVEWWDYEKQETMKKQYYGYSKRKVINILRYGERVSVGIDVIQFGYAL